MVWLQNLVVVVVGYLLSRLVIEENLHLTLIDSLLKNSATSTSRLTAAILSISYGLSLFFPNTVVVISLVPLARSILERVPDPAEKKYLATGLALAMIYGANIGGMASMTGAGSNLVFLGYAEFWNLPGREHITFFSWFLLGVPVTLVMLWIGKTLLAFHLPRRKLQGVSRQAPTPVDRQRSRRIWIFFIANILSIFLLSGMQFLFAPPPLWNGLNAVDLLFLAYLVPALFFSFIFPQNAPSLGRGSAENLVFFLFFLLLSPLVMLGEAWAETCARFRPQVSYNPFRDVTARLFNRVWQFFFGSAAPDMREKNPRGRVSVNRLLYDLPYLGLVFMGIVVLAVYLVLKLSDDPATPNLDGRLFQAAEYATGFLTDGSHGIFFILTVLIFITIYFTEVVSNTAVMVVMFSLVSTMAASLGTNPLFLMLAVTIASTAAFMTPVASSVNAVSYAALPGVSLKRMLVAGFFMNLACAFWLALVFNFLHRFAT